ncbi:MAG TPA: LytTR family DNA-binding domain-containing protein [Chitinophagales bacterium]|jgi:two-component system LytT family response regulator|nr:LytTR family DNA-binding domain-containing protein [Chitinophagales bacterium]
MDICIIDDEKDNREILSFIINTYHKDVFIVGEADSVQNGILLINATKPDLIFLDIDLPDGTGFDLIRLLHDHKPEIIFCTAYNQFALKAIECSALGYVLKPIIKDSIADALKKASAKLDVNHKVLQYEILQEQLRNIDSTRTRFLLSNSDKMHIIYIDQLICCIAHSNYTDIHLEDNKKITVAKTLKEIENILQNFNQFIRIHHSNIINFDKIIDINKTDNNISVIMSNKMELAVSRSKKEQLLSLLH